MEDEAIDVVEREAGGIDHGTEILLGQADGPLEDGPAVHPHELLAPGQTLGAHRLA